MQKINIQGLSPEDIAMLNIIVFRSESGRCDWLGCKDPYPEESFMVSNPKLNGARYGAHHDHDYRLLVQAILEAEAQGERSAQNILARLIREADLPTQSPELK